MFKNVLLLTFRRLLNNGTNFIISLLSLSVGIASVILMFFYINFELSYDKFNKNYDNLYRVERTSVNSSQRSIWDSAPYRLAAELTNSVPEIHSTTCVAQTRNYLSVNNQFFKEEDGLFANKSFLHLMDFHVVQGDCENALEAPMKIVLSQTLANKLFKGENALGKVIEVDKKHAFEVSGVFEDYPKNSHLKANYILSFASLNQIEGPDWDLSWERNNASIYALLNKNTDGQKVSSKITHALEEHLDLEEVEQELLSLRPMGDIYLNSGAVKNDKMLGRRNNIVTVIMFLGVALFTIIITVINYINSITAQLLNREKEIGVKKVLSIPKSTLRLQFIMESIVSVTLSFVLATLLVFIAVPIFNSVIERSLSISVVEHSWFFGLMFLNALVLAILVGLYPVFFLSSLKITAFLQGTSSLNRRRRLRKILVVLQLVVGVPLIFSSMLFVDQIKYLENKDLGFQKDGLLVAGLVADNDKDKERIKVLKNTLESDPNVLGVSISDSAPFAGGFEKSVNWDENDPDKRINLRGHRIDYDFLETYKMDLIEGRNFTKDKPTDLEKACLVNQSALKQFGWTNAVGKKLKVSDEEEYEIIGTVADFHDYTLFYEIPPMIMTLYNYVNNRIYVSIKVGSGSRTATQQKVNTLFNERFPNTPVAFEYFESNFAEDQFFKILRGMSKVFIFFSFLTIFLAMIGLYNLVSFSLKTQRKMIAIRKVLGAENSGLFTFLAKEYMILFGIAIALSLVSTFFINTITFSVFPYKTDPNPMMIFGSVMAVLLFLLLIISGKIYSASRQNPIRDLKAET